MEPTTNNNNTTPDSSANTVLIAVVIVVIIGIAFYFGIVRGHVAGGNSNGGVNVELNTPSAGGDTGAGAGATGGTGATQ